MQKISKKILDYFISQNEGCAFECYYESDIEDLATTIGFSYEDTCAAADYLAETGYLQTINGTYTQTIGYKLSHKGQYYKSFKKEEFINFFTNSILIPVIVAFITALLTS